MNSIEQEITKLTDHLAIITPTDPEYKVVCARLLDLYTIKKIKPGLNNDIILSGLFNLTGMILVMNYEKLGILTGKAFSMIPRMK